VDTGLVKRIWRINAAVIMAATSLTLALLGSEILGDLPRTEVRDTDQ